MRNRWILLANLTCALAFALPSAGAAPAPGNEMEQEIDAIVKKITEKPAAKVSKPAAAVRVPAGPRKAGERVPQPAKRAPTEVVPGGPAPSVRLAPRSGHGARGGPDHTAVVSLLTPPLPGTLTMSPDELSALRRSLFGKPRWRVEADAMAVDAPAHFALPRGI